MKIIHTSDWHLGKTVFGKSMIEDQGHFIRNFFLPTIETEKPDLILISGDVFDKPVATLEAIRLFNEVVEYISNKKISVVVVAGNHDCVERISVGSSVLRTKDIYFVQENKAGDQVVKIKNEDGSVTVYAVPFLKEDAEKSIKTITENLEKDSFNILVSHCFVTGRGECNDENKISVGFMDEVNKESFDGFDYVALGHLHSRKKIGDNIFYSGSPLAYSFDEEVDKSINIVNIDDGKMEVKRIPVIPLRLMRRVKGKFKEVVELGKTNPSDDYIMIELTDNEPIYMPMTQLRVYFPNILALRSDFIKSRSEKILKEDILTLNQISDEEIFLQFMDKICDVKTTEYDIKIFNQEMNKFYQQGGA